MLEDKLQKASREAGRRSAFMLAGFAVLALVVAVFAVGATLLVPKGDSVSVSEEAVRQDSSPVAVTPADPAAVRGERSARSTDPRDPRSIEPAAEEVPDPAAERAREQFKDDLAAFQADIEPQVTDPAFAIWNADARRDIIDAKTGAVDLFAQGAYAAAVEQLGQARQDAETQIARRDQAFQTAFGEARTAYAADAADAAALAISRASALKPDDPATQELAGKIARLPDVLSAIGEARVARTENNLAREADALERVLELDPGRTEQANRLEQVRKTIRDRDFADHVSEGFRAVDNGNVAAGRRGLEAARSIYRDRNEIAALADAIEKLAREQEFRRLVAEAEKARAVDDWRAAEDFYARAGAIEPDDPKVNGGYSLAGEVLALDRQVSAHLDSPGRLSSEKVAEAARGTISRVRDIEELSPGLAARARELASLVAAYETKVPVRILSDGVTHISVRGVGQVGATDDRVIELRPGSYTFEGKRPGFRSKLVMVDIPPGADELVLEIYPDERI